MADQINNILLADINECLRDSPKFRQVLQENEKSIEQLEARLEKVVKTCGLMVESGRQFAGTQQQLLVSMWDMAGHFTEPAVCAGLNRLLHALTDFHKYQSHVLDQAARVINSSLGGLLKTDIREMKESRQCFERISGDLDTALIRYSQAPKSRPQELEESTNIVKATRTCFRHTALDYLRVVTLLQSKKQHQVLDTVRSYVQTQATFFHQGYDLWQDLSPHLKDLDAQIASLRKATASMEQQLDGRHSAVTHEDIVTPQRPGTIAGGVFMEGYLFKRTTNAFKTWNRRWFTLENHQLKYRRRTGDDLTVMEDDLRLCAVKPAAELERRHCFEVVSPLKSHVMQADSESSYRLWVDSMQAGIGAAFDRVLHKPAEHAGSDATAPPTALVTSRRANVLDQVRRLAGNEVCCDCGHTDPTWASMNLGITLCIECSGIHRSLGVQVSKIRSLTLDAWEPEILRVFAELGNTLVNGVYEACVEPSMQRPDADTERGAREAWIRAKYAECRFVRRLPGGGGPPVARRWSVRRLRRRPRSSERRPRKSRRHRAANTAPGAAGDGPATFSALIIDGSSGSAEAAADRLLVFGDGLAEPAPAEPDRQPLDISSGDSTAGEDDSPLDAEAIADLHPNMLLFKAAAAHNLPVMCGALALRADPNWHNTHRRNGTALHEAVNSGSVMACQHLLLNGSKPDLQDSDGRTPLHLAVANNNMGQVCVLLKHKAEQRIRDGHGRDPLQIAVENANADIVTLLRVGLLNEEMREADVGNGDDDTFHQVVKDFSRMASDAPEKLSRRSGHDPDQPETPPA